MVADISGLQSSVLVANEDSDERLMEVREFIKKLNVFLDVTKGIKVGILIYFPDVNKFKSVVKGQFAIMSFQIKKDISF